MEIRIQISEDGKVIVTSQDKPLRPEKGKSLLKNLLSYTVIDIETTGLDPRFDEIIELGAIRIRNGVESERFEQLVKPDRPIDEFITELTGITNEMLESAPNIQTALPDFLQFIGDDFVVGHNVNFDINFIYDTSTYYLKKPFTNSFVDIMRLSRRLFPDLPNHKLNTLSKHFKVNIPSHRGISDCISTFQCYEAIKKFSEENNIDIDRLPRHSSSIKAKDIVAESSEFNTDHPLYGKVCVFTGVLEKMVRKDAMQIVANLGGINEDNVTKRTNFLILGNNDYCSTIKDGKSNKHKKAEKFILKGNDLQIISENTFYSMLE